MKDTSKNVARRVVLLPDVFFYSVQVRFRIVPKGFGKASLALIDTVSVWEYQSQPSSTGDGNI
jgi:hypothetical protein